MTIPASISANGSYEKLQLKNATIVASSVLPHGASKITITF